MRILTQINHRLRALGREERLVRGKGYYYLCGGEAGNFRESGIYGGDRLVDLEVEWRHIVHIFELAGITLGELK